MGFKSSFFAHDCLDWHKVAVSGHHLFCTLLPNEFWAGLYLIVFLIPT